MLVDGRPEPFPAGGVSCMIKIDSSILLIATVPTTVIKKCWGIRKG